jgi:hypothetical protein
MVVPAFSSLRCFLRLLVFHSLLRLQSGCLEPSALTNFKPSPNTSFCLAMLFSFLCVPQCDPLQFYRFVSSFASCHASDWPPSPAQSCFIALLFVCVAPRSRLLLDCFPQKLLHRARKHPTSPVSIRQAHFPLQRLSVTFVFYITTRIVIRKQPQSPHWKRRFAR